jgi:hypothetical protein
VIPVVLTAALGFGVAYGGNYAWANYSPASLATGNATFDTWLPLGLGVGAALAVGWAFGLALLPVFLGAAAFVAYSAYLTQQLLTAASKG